jgi:hypothetical protein
MTSAKFLVLEWLRPKTGTLITDAVMTMPATDLADIHLPAYGIVQLQQADPAEWIDAQTIQAVSTVCAVLNRHGDESCFSSWLVAANRGESPGLLFMFQSTVSQRGVHMKPQALNALLDGLS